MKLLFLVAEEHYFVTHRLNLAKEAIQAGYTVSIAARIQPHSSSQKKIIAAGIKIFPLQYFTRAGLNPWLQFLSLLELIKIYRTFKPKLVHQVGMKPVILGSLVAILCRVPFIVNALGGLGYLFIEEPAMEKSTVPEKKDNIKECSNKIKFGTKNLKIKKQMLKKIVSFILGKIHAKSNCRLILQNQDDIDTLLKTIQIDSKKISLIRGAGVDLNTFAVTNFPSQPPIMVACVARMLWDKGIGELVSAAIEIKQKKLPIQILLYGAPDAENPASISEAQLRAWHDKNLIKWYGQVDNIAKVYSNCHIAVLPSYREGLPKSLLEAASCGRPIIATDVPGCREIVEPGSNGFLIPPRDVQALVSALINLSNDKELQQQMGKQSRELVERCFSDKLIHQQTLELYSQLMNS